MTRNTYKVIPTLFLIRKKNIIYIYYAKVPSKKLRAKLNNNSTFFSYKNLPILLYRLDVILKLCMLDK